MVEIFSDSIIVEEQKEEIEIIMDKIKKQTISYQDTVSTISANQKLKDSYENSQISLEVLNNTLFKELRAIQNIGDQFNEVDKNLTRSNTTLE